MKLKVRLDYSFALRKKVGVVTRWTTPIRQKMSSMLFFSSDFNLTKRTKVINEYHCGIIYYLLWW